MGSRVGPRCAVGDGVNVPKDGPGDEPREVQYHDLHARLHMGEVGVAGVQETGGGRVSNVQVEEEVSGKFHRVWRDGGSIISQAAHGEPTQNMHSPDEGFRQERLRTYHIRVVLPQDTSVGGMPSDVITHNSTQCGKAAGTLYVQVFLVTDSDGLGGKGTAALLRHVWNAHAIGADHQVSTYGAV